MRHITSWKIFLGIALLCVAVAFSLVSTSRLRAPKQYRSGPSPLKGACSQLGRLYSSGAIVRIEGRLELCENMKWLPYNGSK